MTRQLLDGDYAPITSEIEFLECDVATAVDAFEEWLRPLQAKLGIRLDRQEVTGDLPERLDRLLPLTGGDYRRFLFVPTRSNWIAFFANGWRGNDASAIRVLNRQLGCRAIRAAYVPHTIRQTPGGQRGRFGATILEIYSAKPIPGSPLNVKRSLYAVNDGGRWKFGDVGEPQAFEQTERYKAKSIRDRFTSEMLDAYLRHFGIDFFSSDFYSSPQPTYLIGKQGPAFPSTTEYSLEEARISY